MPDTLTELTLTSLAPEHIPGAVLLSRQAGWPHRAEDWALTLSVSQGVVVLDAGRVVGTALCSRFGRVGLLNMIIVAEEMRGRGLGRRLMEAAMRGTEALELRLVATHEGLPLYRKLGFEPRGEIFQHQGILSPDLPQDPAPGAPEIRIGSAQDLPQIARMDRAASGLERKALLERILPQGRLLLYPGGFALLRPFGRGHVLGPVVADSPDAARALILAASAGLAGCFLRLDLPDEAARDCTESLAALGLGQVGGGIAMTRPAPATPDAPAHEASGFRTFALVSQALG